MKLLAWIILAAAYPLSVCSFELGESEYVFSSDLTKRGFLPFATSSAIRSIFGMTDGESLYLCFSVDQPAEQMQRRQTLIAEMEGQSPDRTVPNIPVVCVMTQ